MKYLMAILLTLFTWSYSVYGADFYLKASDCKIVVASTVTQSEVLTQDGVGSVGVCERKGKTVICLFQFDDNSSSSKMKSNTVPYSIELDSPPYLSLKMVGGNEIIFINTVQHAFGLSSMIMEENFMGNKICNGVYMTQMELDGMK